jgi:hypothetical protein
MALPTCMNFFLMASLSINDFPDGCIPDDGVTPDLPDLAIESSVAIAMAVHIAGMMASPVPVMYLRTVRRRERM